MTICSPYIKKKMKICLNYGEMKKIKNNPPIQHEFFGLDWVELYILNSFVVNSNTCPPTDLYIGLLVLEPTKNQIHFKP